MTNCSAGVLRKYGILILFIILLIYSGLQLIDFSSLILISNELLNNNNNANITYKTPKTKLNETRAFLNDINKLKILKHNEYELMPVNIFNILPHFKDDVNQIPFIKIDKIKNKLYFYNVIAQRLGNVIECYLVARSIAFWSSLQFEIVSIADFCSYGKCVFAEKLDSNFWYKFHSETYAKYRHKQYFFDQNYWTSYLPKNTNISISDYININNKNEYNEYIEILKAEQLMIRYQIYCTKYCIVDRGERFGVAVYSSILKNLYYNKIFLPLIIKPEIQSTLNLMRNNNKNLNLIKFCIECNDVVIHFRCGDIFGRNFGDSSRGYYSPNYYLYIFNEILKWNIYKNTTIYIIGQCGIKIKQWQCRHIAITIKKQLQIRLKIKNVLVIGDNNLNDDFFNLINAPLLFAASSTFSWIASLGRDKITIIPKQSCWRDWLNWYQIWKPKYIYFFDFHKNNRTKTFYLTEMDNPSDLDTIIHFIKNS